MHDFAYTREFSICSSLYSDQIYISRGYCLRVKPCCLYNISTDQLTLNGFQPKGNCVIPGFEVKGFYITAVGYYFLNRNFKMTSLSDRLLTADSSVPSRRKPAQNRSLMNHFDLLFPQNCRANQGITCLTEGYRAWEWDSLIY